MARTEYEDFDLIIEKQDDAYVASVAWRGTEASAPFRLPWPDADALLEDITQMGGTRARSRSAKTTTAADVAKDVGQRLFSAVFTGDVKERYSNAYAVARNQRQGLRIRLRTEADRRLLDIPWEYLYDATRSEFLAVAGRVQIVRYPVAPATVEQTPFAVPLRILVAISEAAPPNTEPLQVEEEWARLKGVALGDARREGLVALHRVPGNLYDITKALDETNYHVFHYIGHSDFDDRLGDGVLILEGPNGGVVTRSANDVAQMLAPHDSLKLAVFNSCEGARSTAQDPFAGVALSVVQKGIPAVIGMQFEITDGVAIKFAEELYTSLAKGQPVDIAMISARRAIFSATPDIEWGTPVLFLRSEDGQIFAPQDTEPQGREQRMATARDYELGLQALAAGDWSAAIQHLSSVTDADPDYGDAQARLAEAHGQARDAGVRDVDDGKADADGGGHDGAHEDESDARTIVNIVVGLLALALIVYLAIRLLTS